LLTIGNHELYISEIAYEHFNQFANVYGDRYVTSNVKILNQPSGQYETPGVQYRYFTTEQGLRIMAFGVLFDFTGNSNASKITKASAMVKEQWFLDAVNFEDPIDMFVVIGHNPVRTNVSSSTLGTVYQAIRANKPDTPIQIFGGHTHIRDFLVYDDKVRSRCKPHYRILYSTRSARPDASLRLFKSVRLVLCIIFQICLSIDGSTSL
jgi:2',3'-cyclic-nucleotide 2'-phosphodiesterase (5'-nucleotidase family)